MADLCVTHLCSLEHLQVYDNASRGPLGSLKFFFEARGVSWGISVASYLGCIITIATLALDPFTQQILLYSDDVEVAPGSRSSVPRAQIFDNRDFGMTGSTTYIGKPLFVAVCAYEQVGSHQ